LGSDAEELGDLEPRRAFGAGELDQLAELELDAVAQLGQRADRIAGSEPRVRRVVLRHHGPHRGRDDRAERMVLG